jgi:hypothetical protein
MDRHLQPSARAFFACVCCCAYEPTHVQHESERARERERESFASLLVTLGNNPAPHSMGAAFLFMLCIPSHDNHPVPHSMGAAFLFMLCIPSHDNNPVPHSMGAAFPTWAAIAPVWQDIFESSPATWRSKQRRSEERREPGIGDGQQHDSKPSSSGIQPRALKFLPLGISGDQTQHLLARLEGCEFPVQLQPKVVVLAIGTNNIGAGCSSRETIKGIHALVTFLRRRRPQAKVEPCPFVSPFPPPR